MGSINCILLPSLELPTSTCMPLGRGSHSVIAPNIKLTIWLVEAGLLPVSWPNGVQLVVFFCSSVCAAAQGISRCLDALSLSSPDPCFIQVFQKDLYYLNFH